MLLAAGLTATGVATTALIPSASAQSGRSAKSSLPSTITIGAVLPLSGQAAFFGEEVSKGTEIAIKKINAAGGIDGKTKLVFKAVDNLGTTPGQVAAMTNLISTSKNLGMVMGYGAGSNVAIKPYIVQHDLLAFNGGSPATALTNLTPTWINLQILDPIELSALADYLVHVKHYKTAGILGQDDAGGNGQDWATQFAKAFTAAGGKIVGTQMASETATTFQSGVAALKGANPQVVFLATLDGPNVTMINESRATGWNVQFAAEASIEGFGPIYQATTAQGLIHTGYQFNPPKSFLAQWNALGGKAFGTPSAYVGNYYDAVMIYAEALKYAVAHGMGTTGTDVARAIHKIATFQSVFGHPLTINSKGNTTRAVAILEITGGKDKVLTPNANNYKS